METLETTLLESAAGSQWKRIGVRHHHGINIPLFSLRTKQSCGIGEYTDLLPLLPWCKAIGLDVIQLLPLNDVGHDTSPYSALSAFALNPANLGLAHLPYINEFLALRPMLASMQELNFLQRIDYQQVNAGKERFLAEYFKLASFKIVATKKYQKFVADNHWLPGYALFKALRIRSGWQSWEQWSHDRKNPTEGTLEKLLKEYQSDVAYHIFVQFLCFQQLQDVKRKANESGVFLKGDIPILINRESADVWLHRNLFHMEYAAGAPPDMYSPEGQNWGFPIYNWDEMANQNYVWWKERLRVASDLYDIYRLDHVIGFFRIWAIPPGKTGRDGKFIPENTAKWVPQGSAIMKMMLASSPMLPIAEDLGQVPPESRVCLRQLGICGTKVMRWERMWDTDKRFINPADYQPVSMTTVSTHDSETLAMWWEKTVEDSKEYCREKEWSFTYELTKQHHLDILWDSHHSASLFHINLLQEYLALVKGMTWLDIEDERINVPGVISNRNWTYRFRPSVEEIVASAALRDKMAEIVH